VSAFGSELSPTWSRPFRAKEQIDRLPPQARELSERSAPAGVVRPAETWLDGLGPGEQVAAVAASPAALEDLDA